MKPVTQATVEAVQESKPAPAPAEEKPVIVEPMRTFPAIKDLVTDVSWNYEVKKRIKPFRPRKPDAPDGTWRMQ